MAIISAEVETNGWVLRLVVSGGAGDFSDYLFDPDGAPRLTLTSLHAGFAPVGGEALAATQARSMVGMRALRLPVDPLDPTNPVIDETDLGGGQRAVRIALSNSVYAGDTGLLLAVLAGWRTGEGAASGIAVTNNSTLAASPPIMRWATLPFELAAPTLRVALVVASTQPNGFQPVAGVKFTATDGTTVKTIWTTALATDSSYGDNLRCYTVEFDFSAGTALTGGPVRIDAEVYP